MCIEGISKKYGWNFESSSKILRLHTKKWRQSKVLGNQSDMIKAVCEEEVSISVTQDKLGEATGSERPTFAGPIMDAAEVRGE